MADQRVGRGADCRDDTVQIEREFAALDRHRTAAAGLVRLAQLHLLAAHAADVVIFVREHFERRGQELEDNALFLGVMDLLKTGGQLLLRAAVYDVDLLRAHALGAARRVHGHVAAAHDCNLVRVEDRGGGAVLVGLHQIDTGQVLVGRVNAVGVLARHADKARQACARADKDGLVAVGKQLVDGLGAADNKVQHKFNAEVFQRVDLLLHDRLGQTEFRDAVHQHAACGVQGFEYRYLIAHARKVARAGQAGRACAHDRALVAVGSGLCSLLLAMLARVVRDKPLQAADRHRLALDAAHALLLALGLLRAYTAADSRQRGGLLDLGRCFEELALGNQRDELRDLDLHRAARDAGLVLAVQAALRFFDRHFRRVAERDFVKVLVAHVRRLLGHGHLFRVHIRHVT